MKTNWYAKVSGGGSQGLVVDEQTGSTIAVTYDPAHAGLLAAAPDLLAALEAVENVFRKGPNAFASAEINALALVRSALAKARGE